MPAGSEADQQRWLLWPGSIAVLPDETYFVGFAAALTEYPGISVVYLVTDYDQGYRTMRTRPYGQRCYRLYRD